MANDIDPPVWGEAAFNSMVLGDGCFWRTEAVFKNMRGTTDVESGNASNPSHEQVRGGGTGCNEVGSSNSTSFKPACL